MFIDNLELFLEAGAGGNGVVAWRREKYIPKGGPAGGNGGDGGSIIIKADRHLLSLEDLRNFRIIKAKNGQQGGAHNKTGKKGIDQTIKVPLGTVIKDKKTDAILHDLTQDGDKIILCQGGKGGRGNTCFKSSTHQAPNICTEGTKGEAKEVKLELKLIADIGLVGMPNAGKSTLMSQLTSVEVKIAAYPFTTLRPNLGLIEFEDFSRLLIADIPGIIKHAAQNKGLGLTFLRHIERTAMLVFVVDLSGIDGRDPLEDFIVMQKELEQYNPEMLKKPFLIALNKIDTEEAKANLKAFQEKYLCDHLNHHFDSSPNSQTILFPISAATKEGLKPFTATFKKMAQKDAIRFV